MLLCLWLLVTQNPSKMPKIFYSVIPVTYLGCFGDWYKGLGTQVLAPKITFFKFSFLVVFPQKICWSSDQWFYSVSNSKWLRRQKCRQKKKTKREEEVEVKEETVYESV